MPNDETDAKEWKRRERALGAGICLWALGVTVLVTISPGAVASWLQSSGSVAIAGVLLTTIGLCGGLVDCGLIAASFFTPSENTDLTQWDS